MSDARIASEQSAGPTTRSTITSLATLVGLAAFAVVSRAWFLPDRLEGWDPVQHALALSSYDVFLHTPHPPGAPTYHAFLRILRVLVDDPTHTVLVGGVVLAVLAGLAAWAFGRGMVPVLGSPRPGPVGLLLLVSPGLWLDSVSGGSAAGDAALAALVGLFSFRARSRRALGDGIAGAVLLAILIGFRQNVNLASLCLVPLWIWCIWSLSPLRRAISVGALLAACAAWAVPTAAACGGWARWLDPTLEHFRSTNSQGLLFGGARFRGLITLLKSAVKEALSYIGLLWILVAYAALRCLITREWRRSPELRFALWWILPFALGILIAPYYREEYYAVALPIIAWWGALGLFSLAEALGRLIPRAGFARGLPMPVINRASILAAATTVLVFNSGQFLTQVLKATDAETTRYYAVIDGVAAEFDPSTTMILSTGIGQRYASLYLPEFVSLYLPVLEGKATAYAGRMFRDGVEETFSDRAGTVLPPGRAIQNLIITETFQPVRCVPPVVVDDYRGLFLTARTHEGEIAVQYADRGLTLALAGAEPTGTYPRGESRNEAQE